MNRIILGNCLDTLVRLPDKSIDVVLTDPPYGVGIAKAGKLGSATFTPKNWDAAIPPKVYFDEMRRVSRAQIIWGGNYFANMLPASRCWLVWWKNDGLPIHTFADCEMAWTSFDRNAQVFNSRWRGFIRDSKEARVGHPTQKALEVMKWCIASFSEPGDTILDPFLGSGTTAVAAKILGRHYIGIEQDEEYVAKARERLRSAVPANDNRKKS